MCNNELISHTRSLNTSTGSTYMIYAGSNFVRESELSDYKETVIHRPSSVADMYNECPMSPMNVHGIVWRLAKMGLGQAFPNMLKHKICASTHYAGLGLLQIIGSPWPADGSRYLTFRETKAEDHVKMHVKDATFKICCRFFTKCQVNWTRPEGSISQRLPLTFRE